MIFYINGNEFYLAIDFCVLHLLCSSSLRFLLQSVFEAKTRKTVVSHEDRNFPVFSGFGRSGKGKNAHTCTTNKYNDDDPVRASISKSECFECLNAQLNK